MKASPIEEDWEILLRFLPAGWESKAIESRALVRRRKINSPEILLRLLLIHLAHGKSLRTTAAYAEQAQLCSVNDVALLHRLKASDEWFRWMSQQLMKSLKGPCFPRGLTKGFRVRILDGSSISEPGATGSDWRLHYSLQLNTLRCDTFRITDPEVGEDFQRYPVTEGDLLVADKGYCKRKGISYVLENGGHVLVRYHSSNLPLLTYRGKAFSTLELLRSLSPGRHGDWDVWFRSPQADLVKGRLCAIKKSKEAIELAKKKLRSKASRQQRQLRRETLEYAEYVTVFTTVNRHRFTAEDILSLYRGRWQVELVFKRLKSIIGIGHLPKHNPESCIAWLHGKMFVAFLAERLHQEAEFFSPWGYPVASPA
jgi:hypothetical protein